MRIEPGSASARSTSEGGVVPGWAEFAGARASGVVECIDLATDAHRLDAGGVWFVVAEFGGRGRAWRFADVSWGAAGWRAPSGYPGDGWAGPRATMWESSCGRAEYVAGVERLRADIAAGELQQANLCRVLSAPVPAPGDGAEPDAFALARILAAGNPAPFSGVIHVPAGSWAEPVWVVSASPELFLDLEGEVVRSGPIKGTAATAEQLLAKDYAENELVTGLVRAELEGVCVPGSVVIERLHEVEQHPGLVHLVSTVRGRLGSGGWERILAGTFPPASVTGVPKARAAQVLAGLEPAGRGPYCGAVGWVDADHGRATLAVAIRTFWWSEGVLRFGTGAGITWGSEAAIEWEETELKARRLIELASASQGEPR